MDKNSSKTWKDHGISAEELLGGVKASWDSKDGANKILMGMTYVALLYLGQAAFFATYSYRKSVAGRLGA